MCRCGFHDFCSFQELTKKVVEKEELYGGGTDYPIPEHTEMDFNEINSELFYLFIYFFLIKMSVIFRWS